VNTGGAPNGLRPQWTAGARAYETLAYALLVTGMLANAALLGAVLGLLVPS
jgi:hypothetical protein